MQALATTPTIRQRNRSSTHSRSGSYPWWVALKLRYNPRERFRPILDAYFDSTEEVDLISVLHGRRLLLFFHLFPLNTFVLASNGDKSMLIMLKFLTLHASEVWRGHEREIDSEKGLAFWTIRVRNVERNFYIARGIGNSRNHSALLNRLRDND